MTTPFFDFSKRPIVDLSALCLPIPGLPLELCITLPGGVKVCAPRNRINIGALEYARGAMAAGSQMLAPLVPVFQVIDAVLSVFKLIGLIPAVIGPPPDFKQFIQELEKVAVKMRLLARLMPILSFPLMAVELLDIVIASLQGIASELQSLARYSRRIQQAQVLLDQAPGLLQLIKCAESNHAQQIDNLEYLFGLINPVIDLLNIVAGIAQLHDPFPLKPFEGYDFRETVGAAAAIQQAALTLMEARAKIPL